MENQLVAILKITSPQLGSFVKDTLESCGIECFFTDEGRGIGSEYNSDEVYLSVKARQCKEAVKMLLQVHKEYDLDIVQRSDYYRELKKILVPVKLSESCFELCRYAIGLARKIKAEVKLLYVYEDPTLNESERHTVSWERYVKLELQEANRNAKQKLSRFSIDLKKKMPKEFLDSTNIHYRMLKGTPVNVISSACVRYRPDLIIMGACGSTTNGEFLGKTVAAVIEHSNYPVLVVPEKASFQGKQKINVMYGTNFYDADNSSLNKLLKLLEPYDKVIHCIHIEKHDDPNHHEKVDELNKMLGKEYGNYDIKCEIFESDNVVKGFDEFVEKNNIDLISFSKIKRSAFYHLFHANRLKKIISTERIPILVFPV